MTDTPVFVVTPRDPKDMAQVRHVGPGVPDHLRSQADRPLPMQQPKPVETPPGVRVVGPGDRKRHV